MAARYTFVYCERALDKSSPNHFEFWIACMKCFESAVYTQSHCPRGGFLLTITASCDNSCSVEKTQYSLRPCHTRQFSLPRHCIASCKENFLVWHLMFATSLATKNCLASCRESRSCFYFSQCYATSCSVWHPCDTPLQLVSQCFEKEPITIRHNQNAADIFKYSAGVKYNLIAGRKTSCVRLAS